ncbi:MAG: tRNA uridine(34) 5-carboxymethylaminomethyl modification radical SAM/GNAT enzyme Elp3 [Nanoarchaeota archaeon]
MLITKKILKKPTKTISGITPIAVVLPPRKCKHGICTYCPSLNVTQSYTPRSPAVMRAMNLKYNPYEQVKARLEAFRKMNHPTDKIELIIMGGTFLDFPVRFQEEFIKNCYDALNSNTEKSKNLKEAKKKNEKTKHRCVALCIETRPDVCSLEDIKMMRKYGCTRVELGVQIIDDKIYKKTKRGHKIQDVVDATKRLRNCGFKIGYHVMPGLPGSNIKKDLRLFKKLFSDGRFKPDQLKIYPCQVIKGAKIEEDYWKGRFKPYTKQELERLLIQMLKSIPRYCRVMRIMREIHPEYLTAGVVNIDLRKDIELELREKGVKLKEIRYREIGFNQEKNNVNKLKLKVTRYNASDGKEHFLEIVNKQNVLFGLLRLRIYGKGESKRAIIRELHVYGPALNLGEKGKISQHIGLGKWLISEAEKIVSKNKLDKVSVISGVGVREYYRKLGYILEKNELELMSKNL